MSDVQQVTEFRGGPLDGVRTDCTAPTMTIGGVSLSDWNYVYAGPEASQKGKDKVWKGRSVKLGGVYLYERANTRGKPAVYQFRGISQDIEVS